MSSRLQTVTCFLALTGGLAMACTTPTPTTPVSSEAPQSGEPSPAEQSPEPAPSEEQVAEGTATPDSVLPQPSGEPGSAEMPSSEWTSVGFNDLSETQRELYDRAEMARSTFGAEMMGRMTSVAFGEGYPAAINVCAQEANGIASDVGRRFNVGLGRTSVRLRNSTNTAPAWATSHVQTVGNVPARGVYNYIVASDQGELGVLSPISVGPSCLNCHGSAEQLDPGVADVLAELYPNDSATGFAEDDLRGWYWVELGAPQ